MMIFIEQDPKEPEYFEAGKSLAKKLSQEAKPNAIIPLTRTEMVLMKDAYIVGLSDKSGQVQLAEIKPNSKYIAVVDETVNIDDLSLISRMAYDQDNISIGIVRSRR